MMYSEIEKLTNSIDLLAKEIVDKQYALQPEFHRYGQKGMLRALEDARHNLRYLFSAVESGSKKLFIEYLVWVNELFMTINLPLNTLETFFKLLLDVLNEKVKQGLLDEQTIAVVSCFIHDGFLALKNQEKQQLVFTAGSNPYQTILEQYKQYVLAFDKTLATNLIINLLKTDIDIKDIYRYILEPFQIELGRLWHQNKISVAQEHYATALSQFVMSLLYERIFQTPKKNRLFIGTCVQGELHEIGIRMICDYLENCGWNTCYLGANMPEQAIIKTITDKKPDVIGISCTMTFHVSKVRKLIQEIRNSDLHTPVLVGGYSFNLDNELWKSVGADAYSRNFEEALKVSEALSSGGGQ